jgi:carbamoyl-phosphate synthase large subunit
MANVLVTGVGGVGGFATARSLLEHTNHDVIGIDMDSQAIAFKWLARGSVVPPARSDVWPDAMIDIVDRFDVDVVIPLVDEELVRLSTLRNRISSDVPFLAPRTEVLDLALDKYRLARYLSKQGANVPRTRLATETDGLEGQFPLIIKPRRGRGSRGVELLESIGDLDAYLSATDLEPNDLLLQEYIEGTEYTTSVVATEDDRLLAVVPKEVLVKRGNTVRGVTRRSSTIDRSCRDVFDALRPYGPMNVQQIRSEQTGEIYTIEVNPRFSSTACLTVAAGVNELDLLVRDALDEQVRTNGAFDTDLHMIRYTDQRFATEEELTEPVTDERSAQSSPSFPPQNSSKSS